MSKRVALVTGSNKGIGYAIVRALCKKFEGDVILTSRDEERGASSIRNLNAEDLKPKYHQLDIDDAQSIVKLRDFLLSNYGGLDVLVNNAAIAYKQDSTAPFGEQAEITNKTNFWGTLQVCDILFPILKNGARVSTVSSMAGAWALNNCSPEKKAHILALQTIDELKHQVGEFVNAAKDEAVLKEKGWPKSAYGTSKIFTTSLTILQQGIIDKDESRKDIVINCCCPGYVDTDMTSHKGPLSIDEGAVTPVYLALLPANCQSPKGNYVKDLNIVEWK